MSVSSRNSSGPKAGIPVPVIVTVVVLLVAFVVWMGYRNFGPPTMPAPLPPTSNEVRMQKMFKDSGGDLTRLSEADRKWLHDYSGGREQEAFSFLKSSKH